MKRLTRREFLSKTTKTALGLGIASQLGFQIGCHNGTTGPSEAAWRQLANSLQGMLLRPGDALYDQIALPRNLAFAGILPQGIVFVAGPADVQTSVRFAREHSLPAVARSGNHSYAGYSLTTGLLIDLSNMSSIGIDTSDGIVDVAAGALLGAVADATAPFNLLMPSGRCSSVGIAGLLLGGGFGFNGRKFGLTCDNLVQTQIVTADGELLNCNETENSDLFWACRGGGGGNFSINVAFQVQTHPVSTASVYELVWDVEDAHAAWAAMQEIGLTTSNDFSMRLGMIIQEDGPLPGSRNQSLQVIGQLFGGSAEELREILDPAFVAAEPSSSLIEDLSFADATLFLEEFDSPDAFLSKSAYLIGPLPEEAIAIMLEHFFLWPADSREAEFKIFSWGGAYNQTSPEATAFVHRSADYIIESDASWHSEDPVSVSDASKEWIQELFVKLQPFFTGSAYQNFIDPTLIDWQSAYYGANFARLVDVKRTFDPDDFFNFAQSIPT